MYLVFPRLKMRVSIFAIPALLLLLWCEGTTAFLILVLSASAHELGHLLAIKRLGYRYGRIDLLPMGALITLPEGIVDDHEWKIALAGPATSLLLAMISGLAFLFLPILPLLFAMLMNFVIGLFNLLPIKHMDGGKALFCFLASRQDCLCSDGRIIDEKQKKTERLCSVLSRASVMIFVFITAFCISATGFNLGAILLSSVLLAQLLGK